MESLEIVKIISHFSMKTNECYMEKVKQESSIRYVDEQMTRILHVIWSVI